MAVEKIYFNGKKDDGGIVFTSKKKSSIRCILRFAGNPKFVLKEYVKQYGREDGVKRYNEMLQVIYTAGGGHFSPFVLYVYNDDEGV